MRSLVMAQDIPTPKQTEKAHTRITVTLEPEAHEKVVREAREKRVSASWIVREAVRNYFGDASSQKPANQ
jgi:hypothetical protein